MSKMWKRILLISAAFLIAAGTALWADQTTNQHFNSYEVETDITHVFANDGDAFGISGCEITDGLITVTGNDPQFVVNSYDCEFSRIIIKFKEPVNQAISLQVFYVPVGGGLSEQNSIGINIDTGVQETIIPLSRARYSLLRFDFEQNVHIREIYVANTDTLILDNERDPVRIGAIFSIIFIPLCIVILVGTRKKNAETKKERKKAGWLIFICNLFLSMTVVFFQPLEYILVNTRNYAYPVWNIWWLQLLVSIGIAIVLSLVMLALPAKGGRIASLISLGAGCSFLMQSLLFNKGWPFDMNTKWEMKVGCILIWFWIILFIVTTVYYFFEKYGKKTERAVIIVALLLIIIQGVNYIMLETAYNTLARQPNYLSDAQYKQYFQPNNMNIIHLEKKIIHISMNRGLPFLLKDHFPFENGFLE